MDTFKRLKKHIPTFQNTVYCIYFKRIMFFVDNPAYEK